MRRRRPKKKRNGNRTEPNVVDDGFIVHPSTTIINSIINQINAFSLHLCCIAPYSVQGHHTRQTVPVRSSLLGIAETSDSLATMAYTASAKSIEGQRHDRISSGVLVDSDGTNTMSSSIKPSDAPGDVSLSQKMLSAVSGSILTSLLGTYKRTVSSSSYGSFTSHTRIANGTTQSLLWT